MAWVHTILHFLWMCLPFNLGIPIEAWSSIFTAAIGFLGVYMAAHPPEKNETGKKWFYKISFLVLASVVIAMTWRQNHNDKVEKAQMFLSSSNQLCGVQRSLEDYKKANEHPIPSLPYVAISTLPGLPEGMTNDSHLRFHQLLVINKNDVELDNFCSRLQLPEPISATIETNQTIGVLISWRPDVVEKMIVNGTGGRNSGGMWIGPNSTISPLYPDECFYSPEVRPISATFSGAKITGIWQLTIDKIPPKGRVEISFLTSNSPDVTNYIAFAARSISEIPPKTRLDTNELRYLFEGQYEYQAEGKPGRRGFFVPIIYDQNTRDFSSLNIQLDYGHWRPVTLEFY